MRGRDVLRVLIAMTSVLSRIVFCTSVSAPLHLPLGGLSGHFGGGHSGDGVGAGAGRGRCGGGGGDECAHEQIWCGSPPLGVIVSHLQHRAPSV